MKLFIFVAILSLIKLCKQEPEPGIGIALGRVLASVGRGAGRGLSRSASRASVCSGASLQRARPLNVVRGKHWHKSLRKGLKTNSKKGIKLTGAGFAFGLGVEFADMVADWLANNDDVVHQMPKDKKYEEKIGCYLCQALIIRAQQALEKKGNAFDKMNSGCNMAPQAIRSKCKKFVEDYGSGFVIGLASGRNDDELCFFAKECDQNDSANRT